MYPNAQYMLAYTRYIRYMFNLYPKNANKYIYIYLFYLSAHLCNHEIILVGEAVPLQSISPVYPQKFRKFGNLINCYTTVGNALIYYTEFTVEIHFYGRLIKGTVW